MAALRFPLILAVLVGAPLPALAGDAQFVSYRYDGAYEGAARLSAGLSDLACRDLAITRIDIRDGALRAYEGGRQTVKGLVFKTGFFSAHYYLPDGRERLFEGRIDAGDGLAGGVIDDGCAWVVELQKRERRAIAPRS